MYKFNVQHLCTDELGHLEMVATIVHQLTRNLSMEEIEDMAAEQKARSTYDNILRLIKDPDICEPIKFLRAREVVHYQRFGEALRITQDHLNSKNFYAFNPGFDRCESCDN